MLVCSGDLPAAAVRRSAPSTDRLSCRRRGHPDRRL